jgi:hypothetical protein
MARTFVLLLYTAGAPTPSGTIDITSTPGRGTRLTGRVPAAAA